MWPAVLRHCFGGGAKPFQEVDVVVQEFLLVVVQDVGDPFPAFGSVGVALLLAVFPVGQRPLGFGEAVPGGADGGADGGHLLALAPGEENGEETQSKGRPGRFVRGSWSGRIYCGVMHGILPPHLAERLSQTKPQLFSKSLQHDAGMRHARSTLAMKSASGQVKVLDANGTWDATPDAVAAEDLPQTVRVREMSAAVNAVLHGVAIPDGVVRYGEGYANAFYDGRSLVFGMGDGQVFKDFTLSLDVFAHELGHRMIDMGPRLEYHGEPGALNEHVADVIGISVRTAHTGVKAWKIGDTLFHDGVSCLRDMENPGSAYNNPALGKDPQPGHMRDYVHTFKDNGGVHINSGIPNKAFVIFSEKIQEPCHQAPLSMWLRALKASGPLTNFSLFAGACVTAAGTEFGHQMRAAWASVGVVAARGIRA